MNQHQDRPLKRYKSLCSVVGAVLTFNLSSFYFGYALTYFNTIDYSVIHQAFHIPFEQGIGEGIYSGSVPFGAIFGAFCSNFIINYFSRKHCFYFGNAVALLANILVMLKNAPILLIGRIIQGFCVGFFSTIVPIMVKQYSPVMISGPMGGFQNIMVITGAFFAFFLAYGVSFLNRPSQSWYYVFSFLIIVMLVQQILLMRVYTSQTPKYLLAKGRNHEARQLIEEIYEIEFQQVVYHEKLKDLEADHLQLEDKEKQYPQDHPIAIFLAFFLHAFQQLSGINVIILYSGQLAEGFLPSLKIYLPLILNGEKIIVSLIGTFLLTTWGRKTMLSRGIFTLLLSCVGLFIGFTYKENNEAWVSVLIISCLILYICSFAITFGPLVWLYVAETVQPTLVPFAAMTNWFFATLIISSFPIIRSQSENKDVPGLFLFYSICILIALVVCLKLMVETKDKTEIEIREEYNMIQIC